MQRVNAVKILHNFIEADYSKSFQRVVESVDDPLDFDALARVCVFRFFVEVPLIMPS